MNTTIGTTNHPSVRHTLRKVSELASPAMVDGTWYFRTHGHLMAVGKS